MDRAELAKAQAEIIESEVTGDYFYTRRGYLVFKNGRYVPIDKSSLRLRLSRVLGNQPDTVNDAILAIEDSKFVSYCGPLAGCDRGLHETADGEKILATHGPKIIPSWEGDWTEIKSFLSALFADDTFDQLAYFFSWLQSARLAMLARKPSPGQLLALVGPRACGKTQLVQRLIKPSMGGREGEGEETRCSGERLPEVVRVGRRGVVGGGRRGHDEGVDGHEGGGGGPAEPEGGAEGEDGAVPGIVSLVVRLLISSLFLRVAQTHKAMPDRNVHTEMSSACVMVMPRKSKVVLTRIFSTQNRSKPLNIRYAAKILPGTFVQRLRMPQRNANPIAAAVVS